MSRLSVHGWSICFAWQHIWFCSFDEARRPTCPCGWTILCQCVLMSKAVMVLKACFESLQFHWRWGLGLLLPQEVSLWNGAERRVTSTAQEFAGSPNGRSWSTWLNFRLKFYYFFSLKVKENTHNRERGIYSWFGLLARYFWPCEWGRPF